ncbi:MAG: MFS transporter [Salinibacter sp.]
MAKRDVLTILLTTFMGMALLYAPQPVFPVLAEELGVSETTIASLITWSLLPMAIVPLFGGLLMQVVSPRRLLAGSAFLLAGTELAFTVTEVFWGLVAIRFVQGALVSTLLAATMTYVSLQATRVARVMALYVAASVLGGLVGRLAAGYGAAWIGISAVFLGIGGLTLGGAVLAWGLEPEPTRRQREVNLSRLGTVLQTPSLVPLYGVVFSAFFVFTALLNYAPFRISDLGVGGTGASGLAYIGFLLGIAASLLSHRIVEFVGGKLRAITLGSVTLGAALGLAWVSAFSAVTASIVAASGGFFLLHAVLSGYVNQSTEADSSLVNGLYVAIYYTGGAAGSYVPGLVYEAAGWTAFLGVLALVNTVGLGLLWYVARQQSPRATPAGSATAPRTKQEAVSP